MSRDAKNSLFALAFVLTFFAVLYFSWDTEFWAYVSAITVAMFALARRYVVGAGANEKAGKNG